ncbi:oligosaccharide flippase family protein [Methylophilaceae bacterium Uisw_099_01]
MNINATSNSWRTNLGYQSVSTLYVALLGFLVSVILARELGVEDFGSYSYILSLAGIFVIIQDGGYKTIILRESVDGPVQSLLSSAVFHVISITILGILAVFLLQPHRWLGILTAVFCMGLVVLSSFVSSLLQGRGDFKSDAIWKIVIRSLTAFAILWALFFFENGSVTSLFVGWSVALLIVLIWPLVKGFLRWPSFKINGELFRASMVFLTIDVATIFYFRSDIVMLEYFGHISGDVGQYSAAYRILEGVILLATPVAQIAFRSLRLRQNKKEFFELLSWLILLMLLLSGLIVITGELFGGKLMFIVFGEQYHYAGELLPLLLFAMLFILPNYILTQGTIALNKEIKYAKLVVIVAFLNIVLNLWLIPEFGAIGAAWTTIFSEGVLFLALGWVMWREWTGVNSANWS